MNPLWLVLIIPAASALGFLACAICVASGRSNEAVPTYVPPDVPRRPF